MIVLQLRSSVFHYSFQFRAKIDLKFDESNKKPFYAAKLAIRWPEFQT